MAESVENAIDALQDYAHRVRNSKLAGMAAALRDQISVGDITGSTAVAIGSDIRIVVNQSSLPPGLVQRLMDAADQLNWHAQSSLVGSGHIQLFLSSPSDVLDERHLALKVVDQIQNDPVLKGRVTIESIAWDRPDAPMPFLAQLTPQDAINQGLARPSECDVIVVILWSRLGTPLPRDRYQKPDGSPYLSGTEWEFEEAMAAAQETGKPFVLVYRRTEEVVISMADPDFDAKREQWRRLNAFFERFTNPDGSVRHGCNYYRTPSEFQELFTLHLRKIVAELLAENTRNVQPAPARRMLAPGVHWPADQSPFPGLRAFGPEDAPIFFGRGRETDGLIKRLADSNCRFLAVVGASGSGKSSLVGAGLLPRLAQNAIPGSANWVVIQLTPDESGEGDPFASLAEALRGELLALPERGLASRLRDDESALAECCEKALADRSVWSEVLLFIDQFEELFTRIHERQRESFVKALTLAARSPHIRLIVTLRADFYHRCAELPALADLLNADQNRTFPLAEPSAIDLYDMITRPAVVAGLSFEPGLARQILVDTGGEPGALALLAYALHQLYEQRSAEGHLTWAAYQSFGDVQGAIGAQAQAAYDVIDEQAQQALPQVFRELVEVNDQKIATRKRAPHRRLAADEAAERLIEALTQARLLVQSRGDAEGPMVEVAHEALLRSWSTLAQWITDTAGDLHLWGQVRKAVEEWRRNGFHESFLWPDDRLQTVKPMLERLKPDLDDATRTFLLTEAERLIAELHNPATTHRRRLAIGGRLAWIGDGRPGVGLRPDGLPDVNWLPVPDGCVQTASGEQLGVDAFYIARYPVTYCQYQTFLEAADGYDQNEWWDQIKPTARGKQAFEVGNHPAENVSWYEAMAFCRWLHDRLAHDLIGFSPFTNGAGAGADWIIRLPTEWEWQSAATGGVTLAHTFPWGATWIGDQCGNTSESHLAQTTAVGMYPHGSSPVGALDMYGNVWEWCASRGPYPGTVMLRSGGWCSTSDYAHPLTRAWDVATGAYSYRGFRLAFGPPLQHGDNGAEQAPPAYQLVSDQGHVIQMTALDILIGRTHLRDPELPSQTPDIDLYRLNIEGYRTVSRRHCHIFLQQGTYFIEDLGSMNGTELNEQPLEQEMPYPLHSGDTITLGSLRLQFQIVSRQT